MKIEYPKYLYHACEDARIVHSEAEHQALGSEWAESPLEAKALKAEKPSPVIVKKSKSIKDRGEA